MPPKGAEARADQMAALEEVVHERRTDPRIGDWLAALEDADHSVDEQANLRLIRHSYSRAMRVSPKLAARIARTTSAAQHAWAAAKQASDFAAFAPHLIEVVALRREEAAALAEGSSDADALYDALLEDYEPGMSVARLAPLLEGMRPRLSALRAAIAASGSKQPTLAGSFDVTSQLALARLIAERVGYDFEAGRLDLSVHPFSSGTGGDARITTRVDADNPMDCLYSTIHELGHALYEQGVPQSHPAHRLMPAGASVSMGVHESQSRLWENQIARSRPFCEWLWPQIETHLGGGGLRGPDDLYHAVNRVETGFIRTEADEVHYNLHVLLRFELERDLIGGRLDVADLRDAWNSRFERDFGLPVPDDAQGILQDVHWSAGLFGYFPTYSLGNIYAAQLDTALRDAVPDLDGQLERGETGAVLEWLRTNIHAHGSILPAAELIEQASGQTLTAEPLLDYLDTKYGAMFSL